MEKILQLTHEIRTEFYDWCCLLSLDEISSNEDLRFFIEEIEKTLCAVDV